MKWYFHLMIAREDDHSWRTNKPPSFSPWTENLSLKLEAAAGMNS